MKPFALLAGLGSIGLFLLTKKSGAMTTDPTPSGQTPAPPVPLPSSGHPEAPPPTTDGTLREGMRGAAVAEWQNFLGISADGIFGPETTRVTKLFQGDHGLEPDGIVGPKTRAAAHLATTGAPPPGPVPVVAPVLTGPPSGYVASRPTDELRQIAKETLALGDPVGTSYPFEMDGKKYLAVVVPETTPGTVLAMDHGGARALVIYQPENQA